MRDAVGVEAHGSPWAAADLPDIVGQPLLNNAGVDRRAALESAVAAYASFQAKVDDG